MLPQGGEPIAKRSAFAPGRVSLNPGRPHGNEREARRILSRVAQEADGSTMASSDRSQGAAPEDDWAEVWGTRIGRVLGPVLLFLCAAWLLFRLSRGG